MSELERNVLRAINSRFAVVWSHALTERSRLIYLDEWTAEVVQKITQIVLDNPLDHSKYSSFFENRENSSCFDNLIVASKHREVLSVQRTNKRASFFSRVSTLGELKKRVDECFELHPNHVDKKIRFRIGTHSSVTMDFSFLNDSEEGDTMIFN